MRKNILKIIIAIFIVLLLVTPFVLFPRFVKIKDVSCNSQYGPCNQYYSKDLDSVIGMSLRDAKDKVVNILNENVVVQKYLVHYQLPSKLEIDVVESKPYYAIKSNSTSSVYLLDDNGNVLSVTQATSLPILDIEDIDLAQGDRVEDGLLFSLKVLYDMNTLFQTAYGEYKEEGLFIRLPNGYKVIFPTEGDQKVLVGGARLIYQQLNSQAQDSKIDKEGEMLTIDMRFKNPVIRK